MVVLDKPNDRESAQGSSDRKQRLRQRFQVVKKLGQGTYGKVQLAINKESKQEVAIKTIKKVKIENEQDMIRIRREIQIMSSIRHPYIIHIYEVFENHEKIVLITQYASGGELYDYLGCHRNLSENEARRIFRQVASAIFYCHKNKICHRDLKLENILLDDKGNAKIADFGLSNVFDEKNKLKTFCGSPLYASPEIVKGHPYCGPEVDCWSLGVLLYTLVYGAMPFDGSNFKRLVKQISEGDYHEPKNKSGASGLIRHLLTVDASCRANITDICNDWWVNLGFENSLLKVATDLASLTPVRQDLVLSLSSMMLHTPQHQAQIRTRNYNKPKNKYDVEQQISGPVTLETIPKTDFLKQTASKITSQQQDSTGNHPESGNKCNEKSAPIEVDGITQNFTNENKKSSSQEKEENELFTVVKTLMEHIVSKIEYNTPDILTEQMCRKDKSNRVTPLNENMSGPDEQCIRNKKYTNELAQRENCMLELKSIYTEDELEKRLSNCMKSNVCSTFQNSQLPKSSEEANRASFLKNETPIVENDSSVISEKNIKNLQSSTQPARTDAETSITNKTITNCLSDKTLNQSSKIEALAFVVPIFEVTSNIPQRRAIEKKTNLVVTKSFDECLSDHESKSNIQNCCASRRFTVPLLTEENKCPIELLNDHKGVVGTSLNEIHPLSDLNENVTPDAKIKSECHIKNKENKCIDEHIQCNPPDIPPRKRNLVRIPKSLKLRKKIELSNDIHASMVDQKVNASTHTYNAIPCNTGQKNAHSQEAVIKPKTDFEELAETICIGGATDRSHISHKNSNRSLTDNKIKTLKIEDDKDCCDKQNTNVATIDNENDISHKSDIYIEATTLNESDLNTTSKSKTLPFTVDVRGHIDILKENTFHLKQQHDYLASNCNSIGNNFSRNLNEFNVPPWISNEMCLVRESSKSLLRRLGDDSVTHELEDSPNNQEAQSSTNESTRVSREKTKYKEPKPWVSERSKQRSLSRARALSMEFESLAEMPRKNIGPPKKPPGKVQIPKYFDPASMTLIKTLEKKEVICIPTSTVSENKEKIERKIEQVKQSALIACPRRKSDVGITNKKKKYVRSQTDSLLRNNAIGDSSFDDITDCADNLTESELSEAQEYANTLNNYENLSYCADHWHSVNSLNSESEECRKLLLPTEECENIFKSQRKNDHKENSASSSHDAHHRHSVDTESGYWTPPEGSKSNKMQIEAAGLNSNMNCNENTQSSRTAFKNSKLRMKLSDEGLDMHSLSSSIDSGIHSWKQEETNLKRFSPESEIIDKTFILMKPSHTVPDSTYGPIVRSCKKIVFQPEKLEKLPTRKSPEEIEYIEGNNIVRDVSEKNMCLKCPDSGFPNNNTESTKVIAQSESQCSSGSYDALDDIFENWVEKKVTPSPKRESETHFNELQAEINFDESYDKNKMLKNTKPREFLSSYSTDKESSDNDDDDFDLMLDEYHPFLYGTDGLWQFLKSVDKNSKNSNKYAKPLCQRSKSQETKDSTHAHNQKKITRSQSKEEKEKSEETNFYHFASEGKLHIKTNSDHLLDDWLFEEGRNVGNEKHKSMCNLDDINRWEQQFMGSTHSLSIPKYSENISLYGTLHRSKHHQSLSSLHSPNTITKGLQCGTGSGEREVSGSACNLNTDSEINSQNSFDIHRKLSLYGTLRTRNLTPHNCARSQVVLNTDDGYQVLYNDRANDTNISPGGKKISKTLPTRVLSNNLNTKNSNNKNTSHIINDEFREMFKATSGTFGNSVDSREKYEKLEKILHRSGNTTVKRRVSFSNDTMNIGKANYSSPLHLHSLNKLREAHEQLMNSNTPICYSKDDDSSDGGSLLEALKAHGYKSLISQRLQNSRRTNETRLNSRISDSFDTDWPRVSNSDKLDYCLGQVLYQQPAQILSNPTENFEHYSLKQTLRMPVVEENNELKEIEADILKQRARKDFNKNIQTYQNPNMIDSPTTVRLTKYTNMYHDNDCSANISENDLEIMNIYDDKNSDSLKTQLNLETPEKKKIKDYSKLRQEEANNKNDESVDTGEKSKTPEIKPEKEIEFLSNKIKALQFRCQRKSLDDRRLQKELKNFTPTMEAPQCSNTVLKDSTTEDYFSDRILDTLRDSTELGESVSDRIWRKSFYRRFNDVPKIQRRKLSLFDYEISPDYKSFKRSGNLNFDESLQLRSNLTHKGFYNRPSSQLCGRHNDILSDDINFLNDRNKEMISSQGLSTTQHTFKIERSLSGGKIPLIDASEENIPQNISSLDLENNSNMNNITELHTGKNETTQNIPQIHGSITVECAAVSNQSELKEDRYVKCAQDESLVIIREHEYETPLGNQNQTSSNTDSTKEKIMDKSVMM